MHRRKSHLICIIRWLQPLCQCDLPRSVFVNILECMIYFWAENGDEYIDMPCVRGIVNRGIICIHNNYIYVYTTVISYIVLIQHRSTNEI